MRDVTHPRSAQAQGRGLWVEVGIATTVSEPLPEGEGWVSMAVGLAVVSGIKGQGAS